MFKAEIVLDIEYTVYFNAEKVTDASVENGECNSVSITSIQEGIKAPIEAMQWPVELVERLEYELAINERLWCNEDGGNVVWNRNQDELDFNI